MSDPTDLEIIFFETPEKWRAWLDKHHTQDHGVWLRMYKKASGVKSINYAEALDEALCYGWIDGQRRSSDEQSFLQRFTPRRAKSPWSLRNTEYVERLIKIGKMNAAGTAEIEAAKQDGRWQAAYAKQSDSQVPEDFLAELKKHPKAFAFYQTLNKSSLFMIYYRLHSAKKEETRERRKKQFLEMLEKGEKF